MTIMSEMAGWVRVSAWRRQRLTVDRDTPSVRAASSAVACWQLHFGEIVAVDDDGRPSFNRLQNAGATTGPILYYVFDVMAGG